MNNYKSKLSKLNALTKILIIASVPLLVVLLIYLLTPITGCSISKTYIDKSEIATVPYTTISIKDASQESGVTKIKLEGKDGKESYTKRGIYKCKVQRVEEPITKELLVGTKRLITETGSQVSYSQTRVAENSLSRGQTKVITKGVYGQSVVTYQISQDEGQPETKLFIKQETSIQPTNEVIGYGPDCDPNYAWACVPNVYPQDVDCSSGNGNGPFYVHGPVSVIGIDRYGLDRGGSGVGCERG